MSSDPTPSRIQSFRNTVWKHYREYGRHDLPWRATRDPYRILVSEMMLQQTQVERVKPYYLKWIKTFPTVKALAKASLADVLIAWQGLGYNRRAKFLHGIAEQVVEKYNGKLPEDAAVLESLWGVGPYTARAVAAFAYNHDAVFIETNIRTAVIHHFFVDREAVSDEDIAQILKHALPRGRAREWYSALMDYGSHLKSTGIRTNAKSKSYAKQSKFRGSDREARGAILKELAKGAQPKIRLIGLLGDHRKEQVKTQLERLAAENLIEKSERGSRFRLPR